MELAEELVAGMLGADFFEPTWVWFTVLCRDNLDDVAIVKLSVE